MPFTAISGLIVGILIVLAGVIVIIWPRIIVYIIGIYFIIGGVLAMVAAF